MFLLAIFGILTLTAVFTPALVHRMGRNAFIVLGAIMAGCLAWALTNWGARYHVDWRWVTGLSMDIDMLFDNLSAIMMMLVLGVGSMVMLYCARYFTDDEPRLDSTATQLMAFAVCMLGLSIADNLLLLYVFWELTTVFSFLLIGQNGRTVTNRRAATEALLVTTAGGLAMLVGVIILGTVGHTYDISDLVATGVTGPTANVGIWLVLIGALSKSAIIPMHFWLPDAMAAPTPVSAYLHAASMVKAGVYLIARLAPAFSDSLPWHITTNVAGVATMLLGGWLALRAVDLKLLLAYSTVSQLGFMIAIAGIGTKAAMTAALTVMMAHALFKAALFMVVGVIDHATGTRDMRKLAGLGRKMPGLMWIAIVAAASAAGIPPLLGFVAKEAALDAILHASIFPEPVRAFLVVGIVGGSILTFAYCLRFLVGAFGGRAKGEDTGGFWVHGRGAWQGEPSPAVAIAKPQSALFIAPAAILAGLGLISGLLAPWFQNLLVVYVGHFPGEEYKLALWHGFNLPLFLTLAVFALGLIAFAIWGYRGLTDRRPWFGSSDAVYDWVLATMDTLSIRFTAFTQRGSVPLIQTVTLVTLMLLPTLTMVFGPNATARLILWESPAQFAIAIIISAVAVGVAFTRNRLGGAIMVGLTGYGCAVIFALRGAPDLALTQFLVETLTLVVFVLILRKLPAEVDHTMTLKAPRVLLAFGIGVGTATLGAIAMAARRAPSLAEPLAEGAVERAHGTNIVNVLLVDIRAWDTMGEISVLVVAATGVASLVFRNRRFGSAPRVSDAPTPRALRPQAFHTTWLLGGRLTDPRYRSLILEVTTRLIFPTIMVLSLHFFFAGHNAPGGGFAGGLTAALALVLRYLAGGRYELGETVAVDAGKVLGAGLLCSAGAAAGSLVLGAPVLSSAKFELTAPIFGHFTANTALLFDLGVYLVVVGLALDVLRSLGVRLDTKIEVGSR